MKTIKYSIYLLLVFFVFTSCEDVIQVDLNKNDINLFVVDAKITTTEEPYVMLSKSILVTNDEAPVGISDAVVTISDNATPANSINLIEDTKKKGYYTVPSDIDYFGVPGREYTVTIESEGVTLTAKDYLARVEPVDSIDIFPSKKGDMRFLAINIFSKETSGIGNYYKWEIFVNDTLLYKTSEMAFASDELVDGNYVDSLEIFIDFHDPTKEEDRKLSLHDTVYVHQNSISMGSYDFYTAMVNQNNAGSPFSVPPANAKSNFTSSDGKTVLGLFTAQDVSSSNKVIIDDKIESMLKK